MHPQSHAPAVDDSTDPIPAGETTSGLRTSRRRALQFGLSTALVGGSALAGLSATPAAAATSVHKVKNLTGPGITSDFGMAATDLGIPCRCPDGRTLFMFGDTWADRVGGTNWRSPTALWSSTSDVGAGVTFSGAVGGNPAQQLWWYDHSNSQTTTVIPADVITLGGSMYLWAMVQAGFGNVNWCEIWRSDDSGASWTHTGAKFPGDQWGGNLQLITWTDGGDGYVYVFSSGFQRNKPLYLSRVPTGQIATPSAYQSWGYANGAWSWGNPMTPVADGTWGEMCMRRYGNQWVMTWFNAGAARIDAMVVNGPTANLFTASRTPLIYAGSWGSEDDTHVAQLYGGYQIPGSTPSNLHLSVSQWNTSTNDVYHVMQFRATGVA